MANREHKINSLVVKKVTKRGFSVNQMRQSVTKRIEVYISRNNTFWFKLAKKQCSERKYKKRLSMKVNSTLLSIALGLSGCLTEAIFLYAPLNAQVSDQAADAFFIENVRIIIGDGNVIENGFLEIENGLIETVSAGTLENNEGKISIDGQGKTIMPALIDGHSHLGYQGRSSWGSQNYGKQNLIDNLEQYAYYGFSAVFSAGSDAPNIINSVENARQDGEFIGARVLYAAGMAPPGQGPNDQFLSHALAVEEEVSETILYGLENPEQARKQVRAASANGIKFIKIWVDDRGGSQRKLSPLIYEAVIEEAENLSLKVFAHQQFASDMPGLLSAGAHGFLHGRIGQDFDSDIANQTSASGAFIIPNWGLAELRREAIGEDSFLSDIFTDEVMQPLTAGNDSRQTALRLDSVSEAERVASFLGLIDAGVDIVLGTDAGAVPDHPFGYTGHRELEIYVRLGMTPMHAIVAGTNKAARHLGLEFKGELKPGFSADIILLEQNPLEDIRNTRSIERVFLAGVEVDRSRLKDKWKP